VLTVVDVNVGNNIAILVEVLVVVVVVVLLLRMLLPEFLLVPLLRRTEDLLVGVIILVGR
jgi:hypothetical protein